MTRATMQPDQVVSTLNSLIEISRDGQKGFQEASDKIESPQIKEFCSKQSMARAQFVGELQPQVRTLGGEPEKTGSVAAALHRGWIGLTSSLGGGDHAILVATETGEDYAVGEYRKALDQNLPAPVRKIVERQFQSVKRAHDKVKGMRDNLHTSTGSASK
ncbi:MAG: ferritin-like domain-containing protein [Burkholderiales bacterium]